MKRLRSGVLSCLLFTCGTAMADTVVLDFEEFAPDTYFHNLTSKNFRISPRCHTDLYLVGGSNKISGDDSGCSGGDYNADYLGSPGQTVYIDFQGWSFSLASLSSLDLDGDSGTVRSSRGGFAELGLDGLPMSFTGELWRNIQWIELSIAGPGKPGLWVDDITMVIPSPPSLWLALLGLAAMGAVRRPGSARSEGVKPVTAAVPDASC